MANWQHHLVAAEVCAEAIIAEHKREGRCLTDTQIEEVRILVEALSNHANPPKQQLPQAVSPQPMVLGGPWGMPTHPQIELLPGGGFRVRDEHPDFESFLVDLDLLKSLLDTAEIE